MYPATDMVSSALCGRNPTTSVFKVLQLNWVWEAKTLTTLRKKQILWLKKTTNTFSFSRRYRGVMTAGISSNCVCLHDSLSVCLAAWRLLLERETETSLSNLAAVWDDERAGRRERFKNSSLFFVNIYLFFFCDSWSWSPVFFSLL